MPFQLTHFQCVCINMSSNEEEKSRWACKQPVKSPGWVWGAWLVIITTPWACSPMGKHYLAHIARRSNELYSVLQLLWLWGFVLCLRCVWSLITVHLFSCSGSFILLSAIIQFWIEWTAFICCLSCSRWIVCFCVFYAALQCCSKSCLVIW